MHGIRSAARLPVVGAPVLVSNGKHGCQLPAQVVTDRVWEPVEHMKVNSIFVCWPQVSAVGQTVNRVKNLRAKGICCNRTTLEVPEKRFAELLLCFGQYLNYESSHSALMRARTWDQGAPCTTPARRSARRRSSSARQELATELSSLVSRLSISAAATAERSSGESRSTSSSTRSIRAFIGQSIALSSARAAPNPSVKLSTNGRPPGPSHRYGVHFLWLGPGVLPLVPAYLER
jgi:hypothetical protein